LRPNAGPVHLNAPFRDPLPPIEDGQTAGFGGEFDWGNFFAHLIPTTVETIHATVPPIVPDVHGVIVAGPAQPADPVAFAGAVGEIARRLGWPVLTDGLSPLRNFAGTVPQLVTTYDAILRNAHAAGRLKPEIVLCLGDWPTSKVLRGWLDTAAAPTLLVTQRAGNRDALHGRTQTLRCSLENIAAQLPPAGEPNGYEQMWAAYEGKTR